MLLPGQLLYHLGGTDDVRNVKEENLKCYPVHIILSKLDKDIILGFHADTTSSLSGIRKKHVGCSPKVEA